MKILITGGAGFIGSHIVEQYLEKGYELFIIDKKPKSHLLLQNSKLKTQNLLHYFQLDLNSNNLENLFSKIKPDLINHHAALVSINKSQKNPIKYSQNNVLVTVRLLELAKKFQTQHFIFASSSAVYGDCQNIPISEGEIPKPISLYGNDKLTCEYFINLFAKDLKTTIFRYSNVFGPRQDNSNEGGVVAIFASNFINNKSSFIYGDGSQTRDLIFVKDIAKTNLLVTQKKITGTFNVSTKQEITILDLFNKFNQITGKNLKPIFKSQRQGDIKKSLLDNNLIKKTLNWQTEFTLEKGLEETISYFKK